MALHQWQDTLTTPLGLAEHRLLNCFATQTSGTLGTDA